MHEARYFEAKCFLTLTFSDENFPLSQAAFEREFVLFIKRLRRASPGVEIKTFGCLELGETTLRPHGHVLVLGRDFSRDAPMSKGQGPDGAICYQSDELDGLWGLGHASVGDLTQQSAGYVARYAMKKRALRDARGEFVPVPHPLTGELIPFRPARRFACSQGMGRRWFVQFGEQAIREGAVTLRGGVRVPIPSYYVKLAKKLFPGVGADAQCTAIERAQSEAWNRTPERLEVRRTVLAARTKNLKRGTV